MATFNSPISKDPEIQGGTPCFTGTRVPVRSLFDALRYGRTLNSFLEQFPSVRQEQAFAVLNQAESLLLASSTRTE